MFMLGECRTIHIKAAKKSYNQTKGFFHFQSPWRQTSIQALQKTPQTWLWSHDLFSIQVCKTLRVSQKTFSAVKHHCDSWNFWKAKTFWPVRKGKVPFLGIPASYIGRKKSFLLHEQKIKFWKPLQFLKILSYECVKWMDILDKLRENTRGYSTNKTYSTLRVTKFSDIEKPSSHESTNFKKNHFLQTKQ